MVPTRNFRILTLGAAVAAWALVAVGGVVRVTQSGLGCPDWPLCHGRPVPRTDKTAILEYSHRATAAVVTVLLVAVALFAWRRYRSRRDILVPALLAAGSVPFQALLGAIVVWKELPGWIVGVHFVIGMLMLAAAVVTAVAAWGTGQVQVTGGFARLVWASAAFGLLLVSAGAAVVSAHADTACGEQWPACNGAFVAGDGDAAIQVVHRTLAYVVAGLAVALAVQAWRGRGPRLLATLPILAVIAQLSFGIALVLAGEGSSAHELLGGLHVAGAGTVWALLVALTTAVALPRRRSRTETPVALPARAR